MKSQSEAEAEAARERTDRVSHAAKDQAGAHASKPGSSAKGTGGHAPLSQLLPHFLLLLTDLCI